MNPNLVSNEERVSNYAAGQALMKRSDVVSKPQVGKATFFNNLLRKARKQHHASNPIVPNMADYVNWIYYDRITFAAGGTVPTNFQLFVIPQGSGGKTKADTNMEAISLLPSPYWMNVTGIGFYFDPNILNIDLNAFLNQSYYEFWVNNKVYIEGKFQCFPGAAGIYASNTQTNFNETVNGWPSVHNLYDLRIPAGINLGSDANGTPVVTDGLTGINILQTQTFQVKVFLPAGALALQANTLAPNPGTGMVLSCYLNGILSRSVQ